MSRTAPGAPRLARVTYSDHLVILIGRIEAAAARVAAADPERRAAVAATSRRESARLSARLSASPLDEATAAAVDQRLAQGLPPIEGASPRPHDAGGATAGGAGGWARALKLEGMPTQQLAALEYANLLACFDAEPDLADRLFVEPIATLQTLHGLICNGLVDPAEIGRPRRTGRAVHDGAQGQVIYNAPAPEAVGDLLAWLERWLGRGSAALHSAVVAGVVHERILEWQPFEAANGRVARAAARLVLRARGLDPAGVAVSERALAADPLGYHREVGATIRRRGDLGPWLERWAEALCVGMEQAAADIDPGLRSVAPAAAVETVRALPPDRGLTIAEYATRRGCSLEAARADLQALEQAGLVRCEPRSKGLRWRRV